MCDFCNYEKAILKTTTLVRDLTGGLNCLASKVLGLGPQHQTALMGDEQCRGVSDPF